MSERVVDELEAVDVEEEDRGGPGAAAGPAAQREREPVAEQRAVRQPRQRVVQRAVSERELGLAPRGDVARDGDEGAVDGAQRALDPDGLVVLAAAPRAEADGPRALAQGVADRVPHQLAVLLGDEGERV